MYNDSWVSTRFSIERGFEHHIFDIRGEILEPDEHGEPRQIGSLTAAYCSDVGSISALLTEADKHSGELEELVSTLVDCKVMTEDGPLVFFQDDHIHTGLAIQSVQIDSTHRGHKLAYYAVGELLYLLASVPNCAIVLRASPIVPSGVPLPWKAPQLAIDKLSAYWGAFGFSHLAPGYDGCGPILGHCSSMRWPENSWAAEHVM